MALDHRRVSVGTALKSNFVVSQSDLWDTHTLSQAKQRQSPRHHVQSQRCQEHSHLAPTMSNASYNDAQTTHSQSSTAPIQRSVSEKNRTKHRHKSAVKQLISAHSETDSEREREPPSMLSSNAGYHGAGGTDGPLFKNSSPKSRALFKSMQHAHHHSTPNVAPGSEKRKYRNKTPTTDNEDADSSLFGACSESELLDGDKAILPIFRKLLTERQPRYRSSSRSNGVGASCPNISIKCDIVEYL